MVENQQLLFFHVLERYKNCTFVQCRLLTGRTHQIRVHMAYIGHPLIGDPKYCNSKNKFNIEGQALHSLNLKIIHPRTKEEMTFTAPIPERYGKLIKIFSSNHLNFYLNHQYHEVYLRM